MNFQIINDDFFDNIREHLNSMVPDFQPSFDRGDGAYLLLAEFWDFMVKNKNEDAILTKCASFINEALELGKHKTEEVIVSEIFEQMVLNNELAFKVKLLLSPKSEDYF
jgi:hypothetical protein